MHILVLCRELDLPESFLFKGLHELGERVTVLVAHQNPPSESLRRAGIPVIPFPLSGRLDLFGMARLRRWARRSSVDLVYALSNPAISAANIGLAGLGIPVVAYRGSMAAVRRIDPASWLTLFNPRVARIVCVSKAVEERLRALGLPPEKLRTIHKGHDPAWYDSMPAVTRADLGIPDNAIVVGSTAVFRPSKGAQPLLQAFSSLYRELPDLHLLLVGPLHDRAAQRAVNSFPDPSRIHLTGFRPDAAQLARLFDISVLAATRRDGLPKSVVEAMAQGIPAIVTRVAGLPELVGGGSAGIVVPPSDVPALAGAIRELAANPLRRQALGAAGKARISQVFGVQGTISQMQALFREVVAHACRQQGAIREAHLQPSS